nr:MAG TPA: hypothetical protein [Caudoviricetes sp.]
MAKITTHLPIAGISGKLHKIGNIFAFVSKRYRDDVIDF